MTTEFKFILQKGSKKYLCPACNKKTFKPYLNTETGQLLPEQYGRCDRETSCNYHLNPYKDGYKIITGEKGERNEAIKNLYFSAKKQQAPAFIPNEVFEATLKGYEQNIFIQNLLSRVPYPFETADVERVISQYYLGTVNKGYRADAITFPFIDLDKNVRAIQVKQFDETNHTTGTDFLHSIIQKYHTKRNEPLPEWLEAYNQNEIKVSCLFGEHLLSKYSNNPIGLVEAPKTAIYSTLYFGFPDEPDSLLWLAVYNLSSLTHEKCKVLQGRDVYLFPDLSKNGTAFQKWSTKAEQFSETVPNTSFKVSDLLETTAPDKLRAKGADIADVLIDLNWQRFRKEKNIMFCGASFLSPFSSEPKP